MRRLLLNVWVMILLAACNTSVGSATLAPQTPIVVITCTSAITPISDVYEQNIHLFNYDTGAAVEITENSVQQEDGSTVYDISYPSPKTGDVPAYLVLPDGADPFAGIILMHGSSGSRETLLPLARDLVVTGAVVLTISGPAARIPGKCTLT